MFSKFKILCVAFFCLLVGPVNGQNVKTNKTSPRLLVDEYYYTGDFDGKTRHDYQGLRIFIVNYSDDTLKYWGTKSRFRDFFTVTGSKDLSLVNEDGNEHSYEKMVIPPHRSQRISLRLAIDKPPYGVIELKVSMAFYKWFKTDHFEDVRQLKHPEIVSDKIIIRYNKDGGTYTSRADWAAEERKDSLNLPSTDLYLLTAADRRYYLVAADEKKIIKANKDAYPYTKETVFLVPVMVYNKSGDTLRYRSMSCSWQEFYHVDNKLLNVVFPPCDSNIPKLVTVLPHSSRSEIVPVACKKDSFKRPEIFRIGVNINPSLNINKRSNELLDLNSDQLRKYNIVWSNKVELKIP